MLTLLVCVGKVKEGITEFPFEFTLKAAAGVSELHDTYHGVYVNIAYNVTADMTRGMMAKSIRKQKEFIVELEPDMDARKQEKTAKPFMFKVAPDSLQNVKESSRRKIPYTCTLTGTITRKHVIYMHHCVTHI